MFDDKPRQIKSIGFFHPAWKDKEEDWAECEKIFFKDHPIAKKMDVPYRDFPSDFDLDDSRAVLARTDPTIVRWRNYFYLKYGDDTGSSFFLLFIDTLIRQG